MPSKLSIFSELWDFMKVRKKWVVGADLRHFDSVGAVDRHDPRVGCSSLYLRSVLSPIKFNMLK